MQMDEAANMLNAAPATRQTHEGFRQEVLDSHAPDSVRHQLAQAALHSLEHGMAELAKLGHVVHMELGPVQHGAQEFPKMMVSDEAPYEAIVNSSQEESDARAKGWKSPGDNSPSNNPSTSS